ncbi:MAG: acetyltransferase [Vulcanimicrobiaceae bacterium]
MNASAGGEAPEIAIIGAGGHAGMLVDALQASGDRRTIGLIDASASLRGTTLFGVAIVGDDLDLAAFARSGSRYFAVGIGAPISGDNGPRRKLFERALSLGLEPLTIVHPSAVVSRWARVGPGAQILPLGIVNAGASIGRNTIVNSGAIVEHDCSVADHVHIATGARLASTVTVGDGAHVGAGATVRQLVTIGARAVVAAGAVVVADVAEATLVAGIPARRVSRSGR